MTGDVVGGYRLLRGLGARALPAYAAIDPRPARADGALCVVEQLVRDSDVSAEAAAEFLRDGKRLAQLRHPNLVHVRDVVLDAGSVLLVTDWVEGEALSEVEQGASASGSTLPLAASLRVLVDLLEGLSALHELRDAKREPLNLVHAEVAPHNVIVGVDGRSVLAHPLRAPSAATRRPAPEVVGYLAPEVLLGDQTADQRADVYGAGVVLWEALMGQRMHAEGDDVGEVVMRILGGKIEAPSAPAGAPWAALLADAARKATAPDPGARFTNATEMLGELRRTIGARLAPKAQIASLVETVAGERIRQRRRELDAAHAENRPTPASPTSGSVEAAAAASSPAAAASAPRSTEDTPVVAAPASSSSRVSAPPTSAEIVEVIEMEVPPDRPSRPRAPPPLRPREQAAAESPELGPPRPPAPSKTDVGSLALVSTPPVPIVPRAPSARKRWTIAAVATLVACAAGWILTRSAPERAAPAEPPGPSSIVSTTQAPMAPVDRPARSADPRPPSDSPRSAEVHGDGAETSPFEPPVEPAARRAAQGAPSKEASPFPSAPPAAPPPPTGPSPHPKKRVYDPMGI